jgi:glutamate/tyrosine decarboxylase-like PLP-dependent enzyme
MKGKIRRLEKLAQTLEPGEEERILMREKIIQYADEYVGKLPQLPAYYATDEQGIGVNDSPISEEPAGLDEALAILREHIIRPGENLGSRGNLAYIPISGLYISALADYVTAITNPYAGIFFSSPGAVRIERMLLRWMADFIGYPSSAAGDLTSGGSIANLMGIVTAREAHDLKTKDIPKSVVYLTEQAHHSIDKGLRVSGLGECIKRYIPLDRQFRMQADTLCNTIIEDRNEGLNPWMICGTAGTTDTGAVDPLDAIADIAKDHQLWFHVDGAYGAPFALCEMGKEILGGIDRSDSLIMNPHKGLFMPLGSGAVLVRDGKKLRQAYDYTATYLQDQDYLASPDEVSPADLSLELSRPFRGLRLWLPLKLVGVAPFRAALEEKLLLTRYFYHEMERVDGFSMGPYPDLSIATFRYIPRRGDINQFNQRLTNAVQNDGRIFISSTTIEGRFTLRLAVLGFRTHLDTIDQALEILSEKAEAISNTV